MVMKRILTIALFILHVAKLFAYVGENFEVDGIWYTIITDATTLEQGKVKVGKIVKIDNGYQLHPMHKSGNLIIPGNVRYRQKDYLVETVGQYAFAESSDLVSVYLPSTIETIESYAFKDCSSLATINLDGIKVFGEGAFVNCTSLTDVSFNKKDQVDIGWKAFNRCTSLTNLTFYKAKLNSDSFAGCVNLEKVVFTDYVVLRD